MTSSDSRLVLLKTNAVARHASITMTLPAMVCEDDFSNPLTINTFSVVLGFHALAPADRISNIDNSDAAWRPIIAII